jgi:hypothetical protein
LVIVSRAVLGGRLNPFVTGLKRKIEAAKSSAIERLETPVGERDARDAADRYLYIGISNMSRNPKPN